jgi:hypothetical protein
VSIQFPTESLFSYQDINIINRGRMSKSNTNNTCQEPEDPIEEVKEDNIKAAKKQKLKANSDSYMSTK